MTKTPALNALAAIAYIILVSSLMFYGTKHLPGPDSVIAPISIISLFTLSAAVMGYIFFYQPVQLYLDGKKKNAFDLFLKTLGIFASITLITLILLFSGIIK